MAHHAENIPRPKRCEIFQSLEVIAAQISNHWKIFAIAAGVAIRVAADDPVTFDDVKPVLRNQCNQCHNPDKQKGGLDLSTYSALLRGGSSGAAVAAGDPDSSTLFLSMSHKKEPFMPKDAGQRPEGEIDLVRKWIAGGLIERKGGAARVAEKSQVAFDASAVAGEKPAGPPQMPQGPVPEPKIVSEKANAIRALAASPWAPLVAIGGERQVSIYNTETLDLLSILQFPRGEPQVLRFSRNARLLLCGGGVGGQTGHVALWDIVRGEVVAEVGDEYDAVLAADVRADQSLVALGGPGRVVRVFKTKDGEKAYEIRKHTDWVTAMEFSPDGLLLATGDRNGGLYLWEADGGQPFFDLAGHQGAITHVSWRKDGNMLASSSEDGTIKLWNPNDGKVIKTITAHADGALSVEYLRNGKLVSCGRDKTVKTWTGDGAAEKTIKGFDDLATAVAVSHDDARIIAGDWRGGVAVFDVADGGKIGSLRANPLSLAGQIAEAMSAGEPAAKRAEELKAAADKARAVANEKAVALENSHKATADTLARVQAVDAEFAKARQAVDSAKGETDKSKNDLAAREADLANRLERARLATENETRSRGELAALLNSLPEKSKFAEQMAKVVASAREAATAAEKAVALAATNVVVSTDTNGVQTITTNEAVIAATRAEATAKAGAIGPAEANSRRAADELAALQQKIGESSKSVETLALAAKEANSVIKAGQDAVAEGRASLEQKKAEQVQAAAKRDEAEKSAKAAADAKQNAEKNQSAKQGEFDAAKASADAAGQVAEKAKQDVANTDVRQLRLKAEQLDAIVKRADARLSAKGQGPFTMPEIITATTKAVDEIPPVSPPVTNKAVSTSVPKHHPSPPRLLLFLGRFHLIVLHIPIGVLLFVFLIEIERVIFRSKWAEHHASQMLKFGAASAILASALGYLLSLEPHYDPEEIQPHLFFGVATAAAASIAVIVRRAVNRHREALYWVTMVATIGLLTMAGHEGAALTHGRDYLDEYLPDWLNAMRGRPAQATADFSEFGQKIRPIFDENCAMCHGAEKQKGKFRLDLKDRAFAGGSSGRAAIVPGDAFRSEIFRRLMLPRMDDEAMPPSSKRALKPEQVFAVAQWINAGAEWPTNALPSVTNLPASSSGRTNAAISTAVATNHSTVATNANTGTKRDASPSRKN